MGLCATIALAEPRLAGKAQLPTAIRITGAVDVFQTLRIPWINCVSGRSDFGRPRGAKPSGASPIAVTPRYGWLVCTARRRSPGIANRLKSVLNGEQAPEPPFVHRVLGIVRVPHRGYLADRRHRDRPNRRHAVGMADLLTATLTAAHQLTVVHYDTDFETAATLLAFQHQCVVPRRSLEASSWRSILHG